MQNILPIVSVLSSNRTGNPSSLYPSLRQLSSLQARKLCHLNNAYCLYCARNLSEVKAEKEHVIGRNFVPTHALTNAWNFTCQACPACNRRKSFLEGEISAITMAPTPRGNHVNQEVAEVFSKKKQWARIRSTGDYVKDSQVQQTLQIPLYGGLMSVCLVGPPSLDVDMVHELAWFQLKGLFGWVLSEITIYPECFDLEECLVSNFARKTDWGNSLQEQLTQRTQDWPILLNLSTAKSYFKAIIRFSPFDPMLKFWALEWNNNIRIVGFFGPKYLCNSEDNFLKYPSIRLRTEIPLDPSRDILFEGYLPVGQQKN